MLEEKYLEQGHEWIQDKHEYERNTDLLIKKRDGMACQKSHFGCDYLLLQTLRRFLSSHGVSYFLC